jgi:hypothetical protein
MREVQDLRQAPVAAPAAPKPAWGNPQRFLAVGLVVFLLAAIAAVIVQGQIPVQHLVGFRSPEAERQWVKGLSLVDSIQYFQQRILPGIEIPEQSGSQSQRSMVYLGLAALAGLAAVGLILAAVGVAGIVRRR